MVRFSFLPREEKFFFLLHQGAMNIQKVADKLRDIMEHYEDVQAKVEEIKALEEFGDQVIHDLMQSLHRTFVTPIDHEDIALLAQRIDDMVDAMEEAARDMLEYKIEAPTPYAREMTAIIVRCANAMEKATSLLHYRGGRLKEVLRYTEELNELENEADQVTSRAMGDLFSNGADAIYILKWRDIYSQLEEATDRAEDAADVLEAIVLKHS